MDEPTDPYWDQVGNETMCDQCPSAKGDLFNRDPCPFWLKRQPCPYELGGMGEAIPNE